MRDAALLLMLASVAGAQPYTIAGVVQNPSGHPQKRVRVAIAPSANRENQTAMITSEDGRFRFDGLPAGKFHLTAEPPTGGLQNFGQRTLATGFGTAVATGTDQHTDNLVFRLIATGAIRGRVTDTDGEPAERVMVQLFVSAIVRGRRIVYYSTYKFTDDRGEYRFGGIRDGSYYLAVAGRPWYANRVGPDGGSLSKMGYLTTYHPGTHDPRGAGLIVLKPGQEVTADFTLSAMPGADLTVTPRGTQGTVLLNVTFEGISGARTFAEIADIYAQQPSVVRGVQPGRYTIHVRDTKGTKTLRGIARVEVAANDTSVEVNLRELPIITGRLWIEDATAIPEGLYVELENELQGFHTRRAVAADGSFRFEGMPPGKYRPLVGTNSKLIHLRIVSLDGVMATEEMIEISKDARLELMALQRGGQVRGDVVRDGRPVEGVLALLAPREESANPLDYRGFQTDSDGTFDFDGLPPGDYVLIVVENWGDFEYANPAAVRPYLAGGRAIKVDGSAVPRVRVELK